MELKFQKFSDFPRGIMYNILKDAYSFDARYSECWDENWKKNDDFFYENPEIADKYSIVTCVDGEPIGIVAWDPRHCPKYVEIGDNGIRTRFKGKGYGKIQLQEAVRLIKLYDGLKKIIVCTNSNLVAKYNYESVGFTLYNIKVNDTESVFSGDYLYYEMVL
jgi:RimJ/RimL family protein N-acetyltransferase